MNYPKARQAWWLMQTEQMVGYLKALEIPRELHALDDNYGERAEASVGNRKAAEFLESVAKGLRQEMIRPRKSKPKKV